MLRLINRLEKNATVWFLLFSSVVFFLLRFPSLFEPDWYKDEAIYETVGFALRHGRLLYSGVFDNKPPMLYLLYAIVNGDQYGIQILSILFGIATIISFFFLAKKFFVSPKIIYLVTTFFMLLLALPLLEGNIANAENFLLFLIVTTANIILHPRFYQRVGSRFFAGLLLGFGFLFKIVALFDFTAFVSFLFIIRFVGKHTFQKERDLFIPFAVGFFIPLLLTLFIFTVQGDLVSFITACFTSNFAYVNYGNEFLIPQGYLLIKTLILSGFVIVMFKKRTKIEPKIMFLFLWFAFSLFDVFFSARTFTHYLLMLLPSFSLLTGYLFNKSWQKPIGLMLFTTTILLLLTFPLYSRTLEYYGNFLSYISGNKSTTSYESFFDSWVPTEYAVASYINTHKSNTDSVYFWDNNAALYKLTNSLPFTRYVVAYHTTTNDKTLKETINAFEKAKKPTYIVIFPIEQPFPFTLAEYREKIRIGEAVIYEKTF